MSHRHSARATHTLTATRQGGEQTCDVDTDCPDGAECVDGVCVDPYTGEPIDAGDETVLEGVRVRFDSGGTSFVRSETGERVERSDTVKGLPELQDVSEGDEVVLEPLDGTRDSIEHVEVRGVNPQEGRSARVESVVLELEDV